MPLIQCHHLGIGNSFVATIFSENIELSVSVSPSQEITGIFRNYPVVARVDIIPCRWIHPGFQRKGIGNGLHFPIGDLNVICAGPTELKGIAVSDAFPGGKDCFMNYTDVSVSRGIRCYATIVFEGK